MSETPFRVAFFSDSSNNSYPENKPTNFRVKLTHPIDLTGKWEVALTALHMVNFKNDIRLGYNNEIAIYRAVKTKKNPKNPKNKDKNTPPFSKNGLNTPKKTFFMPSKTTVAEVVEYLNKLTQKYVVTRIPNNFPHGVSTKKRGILFKYVDKKVQIHLNFGYGIHLGRDICQILGIKNEKIIPNKLGHIVMRESQPYYTVPILNEQISENSHESTVFICTDLIKNQYFESKTLPILKAVICGNGKTFREYDFHPATFCELAKNHFETIDIKIMNRTGAQLNLREEPIYFQLEFRKKV